MVAPDMWGYQIVSQIHDILFSLEINRGNIKLGLKMGNL